MGSEFPRAGRGLRQQGNMMTQIEIKMKWDPVALGKLNTMITKIPIFHREIAKTVVVKKAEMNAQERGADIVAEEDIVKAFFTEVPKAFYSLMVRLMDEVGFNHEKH